MKDLFARLGVSPTDNDAIDEATGAEASCPPDLQADQFDELKEIIANPQKRAHIRRVDIQYRAMAAALDTLDDAGAVDTHRWRERLVEFED